MTKDSVAGMEDVARRGARSEGFEVQALQDRLGRLIRGGEPSSFRAVVNFSQNITLNFWKSVARDATWPASIAESGTKYRAII